jgi:hypothetical protein
MGDVVFLPNLLITGKESFKKFSDFENTKNFSPNVCYLWNRSISPTPILNYCKEQKCYFPDFLQSEIISYRRPKCEKNKLLMGRFFIEQNVTFKESNLASKKSEFFLKWYSKISFLIKRRFRKLESGIYISSEAFDLLNKGAELGHYNFGYIKNEF